jgi:hypothetical protein
MEDQPIEMWPRLPIEFFVVGTPLVSKAVRNREMRGKLVCGTLQGQRFLREVGPSARCGSLFR